MSYIFNRDFEGAFQLDQKSLQRFCDIIGQSSGVSVSVYVGFDDDVDMTYDAEPLESQQRVVYHYIDRVRLKQKDYNAKVNCEIVLRKFVDTGRISVTISGDPDACDRCRLDVLAEIERMRIGHNWFYKKIGKLRQFVVFMLQFFSLLIFWGLFMARLVDSLHVGKQTMNVIAGPTLVLVLILPAITMYLIEKAALRYYSPMIFLFGKGADLQRSVEKKRSLFWGGILIPIIINLVSPSLIALLHGDPAPEKTPTEATTPPAKVPDTKP